MIKFRLKQQTNIFVKAAILLFICFCLVSIIQLQLRFNELAAQKAALESEINKTDDTIEELSDQLARPYDDEYIKDIAREKLNLRMPDEIIYYNELHK